MITLLEEETILHNDYPVRIGYVYIVDRKFVKSNIQGTVADLKRDLRAKEVRKCDIFGHPGAKVADIVEGK